MSKDDFRELCDGSRGDYDQKRRSCTLTEDSYKILLRKLEKENTPRSASEMSNRALNIRDITSERDTNLNSFNTYDEIYDEDGNILIRRPDSVIINNYGSIEFS